MRVDIITIFPEAFAPLELSIIGRARAAGQLDLRLHNLRDFCDDRHRKVDDRPFAGGVGMVMMVEPVARALEKLKPENPGAPVLLCTPAGAVFEQATARELAAAAGLIIICGHYEGIDERVVSLCDRLVSIGDYVLTGGELPAMVIVDAVTRLLPGVLTPGAVEAESFSAGLLDWPHYTRPAEWRGQRVPAVLLSGDHARIDRWRAVAARARTRRRRPDLWRLYRRQSLSGNQRAATGKGKDEP